MTPIRRGFLRTPTNPWEGNKNPIADFFWLMLSTPFEILDLIWAIIKPMKRKQKYKKQYFNGP